MLIKSLNNYGKIDINGWHLYQIGITLLKIRMEKHSNIKVADNPIPLETRDVVVVLLKFNFHLSY